jgi:hypothetical protein
MKFFLGGRGNAHLFIVIYFCHLLLFVMNLVGVTIDREYNGKILQYTLYI